MDRTQLLGKLYINSNSDTAIARAEGLGVEIIDYFNVKQPEDFAALFGQAARKVEGVERIILHGPPTVHPDVENEEDYANNLRLYHLAYNTARIHRTNKLILHSGYRGGAPSRRGWLERSVDFFREFLADKPEDLRLVIENVEEEEPDILLGLIESIGDERVAACWDIGHAQVHTAVPLCKWVEALAPVLDHVHLHNNDGLSDKHWALGQGVIDMAAALDQLLTGTHCSTYTMECDAASSLDWLKRNYLR